MDVWISINTDAQTTSNYTNKSSELFVLHTSVTIVLQLMPHMG